MSWKRVCAVGDVPANTLKKFDIDGVPIVVANYGKGFAAFPPLCPHMEEPLDESGLCNDGIMTCTKHLWQWDLSTGGMTGAAERDLLMYEVKQEGGAVMANIEKELVYDYDEA